MSELSYLILGIVSFFVISCFLYIVINHAHDQARNRKMDAKIAHVQATQDMKEALNARNTLKSMAKRCILMIIFLMIVISLYYNYAYE